MRWSYSRLSSFRNCPYEFYLNYILNDPMEYLSEGNFYAENGSLGHETLEKIFKKELPIEDAAEYYVNHLDDICYKTKQSIMDKKIESCIDYFANVDFDWLSGYEILGVEKEMHFKIAGYDFIAFIDLLIRDKESGEIMVIDHKSSTYPLTKTGKVAKNHEDTFAGYKRQAYIYAYAVHEEYGKYPSVIAWNYFADGGRWVEIKFDQDEYEEVMRWAHETILDIQKEEDFPGNPQFFYCTNLCNFRHSCEYAKMGEWS